jgi:anti-sigma factor RsiW
MMKSPEFMNRDSGHLSDDQLVSFLDAELAPTELERVREHLNACALCQAALSALSETVGDVQKFRDACVAEVRARQTAQVVENFRVRLDQHVQEKLARSIHANLRQEVRSGSWNFASIFRYRVPILASVIAFALVLATILTLRETTASADSLLARSEQRDSEPSVASSAVSRSVLHIRVLDSSSGAEQRLSDYVLLADSQAQAARLESGASGQASGTWFAAGSDYWGALSKKSFAKQPYFDHALLQYMQEQNFFPDPRAAQFRKLVANRGSSETHVESGEVSYGLDYVFAANHPSGIRNAVLWVAKESYSPFQLSIFVINGSAIREFRITRESRVYEQRTSEDARLLTSSSGGLISHADTAPKTYSVNPPATAPLKYAQVPASPSEVHATELLHRLNACLGEEVYVYPMPDGTALVQGLVDSADRRRVLMNVLDHVGGSIRPEIFTPDQLHSGVHLFPSPYADLPASASRNEVRASEQSADLSGRQMAFHDELLASFQSEGKASDEAEKSVGDFSSEISALSEKLLLNAWALERLDSEFPASRTSQLASSDLEVLKSMHQDHRQQIRDLARREVELLARIPLASPGSNAKTEASSQQPLPLAQEQEKLVHALFTASRQDARKSEALSQLVETLRALEN